MNIAAKLHELRTQKGVNEDQVASYLGVTWREISRWENGKEDPPLSIIPRLAAYYEITTDELFSMNEWVGDTLIAGYLEKYHHYVSENMLPEAIASMRDGLIHFPSNYKLKCMLMYALYLSCTRPAVVKHYTGEIFSLAKEILEGCTDDAIRLEAKRVLCLHCCDDLKDSEAAIKIAQTLPSRTSCKEDMIAHVSDGDTRAMAQKQNILAYTQLLIRGITERAIALPQSDPVQKRLFDSALHIMEDVCPDGDFLSLTLDRLYIYKQKGLSAILEGETDEGFSALNQAASLAKLYDALPDISFHTSTLLSGIAYEKGKSEFPKMFEGKTAAKSLLDALMVLDTVESIRYDKRLSDLIQILTKD